MNNRDFPLRLLDGEQIIWSGRPAQGVRFTARDWFLIPFSLIWCGFAIFWESMVLLSRAPVFFALWGIPFILMGLYITVGRFAADTWLRRHTRYALTNRRILIARSDPFGKLTSIGLERAPTMQLTEWRDGRGTIRFGQASLYSGWPGWGVWSPAFDPAPQWFGIEHAQQVFERIQRAGRDAT